MLKPVYISTIVASMLLAGCASVPMASKEHDAALKAFNTPANDRSGVYIYRNSSFGGALTKKINIDKTYIGKSAPDVYFYQELAPGNHTISTESEFSDNQIDLATEGGKNYFVRQYIKMGVFVGGANLEIVSDEEGKEGVLECELAKSANGFSPKIANNKGGPVLASSTANLQPSASAKQYSAEELNARYTYQAEKLTSSLGCTSTAYVSSGPGFEVYSASCGDKPIAIRCDFGRCAAQ